MSDIHTSEPEQSVSEDLQIDDKSSHSDEEKEISPTKSPSHNSAEESCQAIVEETNSGFDDEFEDFAPAVAPETKTFVTNEPFDPFSNEQNDTIDESGWTADFSISNVEESACQSSREAEFEFADEKPFPVVSELLLDQSLWNFYETGNETDEFNDYSELIWRLIDDCSWDEDESVTSSEKKVIDSGCLHQEFWHNLHIVEDTIALKCQWLQTCVYTNFLNSLRVDLNLARLHTANLPAFAAQLGNSLLTPVREKEEKAKTSPIASVVVSKHIDSLAVPPAQFDWRTSGLQNPLTSESVSTAAKMIDLDFLSTNDRSGPGSLSAALQKDLESLGIGAEQPQKQQTITDNQRSLLDTLMLNNSNRSMPAKTIPESELCLEAKTIHDALPNLNYMLSPVLMFPVKNDGPH